MTAVLLALASAALFGGMTVAVRLGLRGGGEAGGAALAFSLEPVWTAFFGFTLAGDRLAGVAWLGCVVIMAGIVIAEPAAADALVRLVRRSRTA